MCQSILRQRAILDIFYISERHETSCLFVPDPVSHYGVEQPGGDGTENEVTLDLEKVFLKLVQGIR